MKRIVFILLSIGLFHSTGFAQDTLKKGYLIACGDDKVIFIDPSKSDENHSEVVWSWSTTEATDLPAEYQELLVPLDECKAIFNNKKLLLTSSGGATIVVDIASRKVEFYAKTPMAHSADLLPGNRIAVANSTHKAGNSLELYDLDQNENVLFTDSLYSGHGAVWNNEYQQLYVLGYQLLKTYSLQNWDSNTPSLKLENSWVIPDRGGHDLFMVNAENFLITTHKNVFNFNTKTQEFSVFKALEDKHNIKSANYFPETKQIAYTIAEKSWWTHNIYLLNPAKQIHIPNIKLYKVRVAP